MSLIVSLVVIDVLLGVLGECFGRKLIPSHARYWMYLL